MSETQTAQPARPQPSTLTVVTDDTGRKLEVKSLGLLEEMDLLEAAGTPTPPDRWMMIATFAACVRTIDGVPCPPITTRRMIRDQVGRVGPAGLRAAVKALSPEDVPEGAEEAIAADPLALAKN